MSLLAKIWKTPTVTESLGRHDFPDQTEIVGREINENALKLFGRSLNIREVDAGSCNGCELEISALSNPYYDMERFGMHLVASPRHADCLLVTGPVTRNMAEPLRRTYECLIQKSWSLLANAPLIAAYSRTAMRWLAALTR